MAKTNTKLDDNVIDGQATIDGVEEQFTAAAADPTNQEMELFLPPDASQYRRRLSEHELLAWVAMQANLNSGPDVDTGMRMFAQAAEADSLSDVLIGKVDTTKSAEILDVVVACHNIRFMNSDLKDGCPYFAIVEVRHGQQNEKDTLSVGGWMVIGQLARMHYQSMELPDNSPFRVNQDTPGALPKESFPHYFRIKTKETPEGHMNYLAPAV
jgi:hypothetical protein